MPEREFAEEWLELSKEEASELFLCERGVDAENIWDKYSDDLGIAFECAEECEGFNGCIGECQYVRLEDITKRMQLQCSKCLVQVNGVSHDNDY